MQGLADDVHDANARSNLPELSSYPTCQVFTQVKAVTWNNLFGSW